MKSYKKLLVISTLILGIQSCALLTPVNTKTTKYTIDKIPAQCTQKKRSLVDLVVLSPETSAMYNTNKMAYSLRPHQIAYYSQNEWAETPSEMFQPLLVGSIQKTRYFHAVVTPPVVLENMYILKTQILELLQDYSVKPARLRMTVRVTLNRTSNNYPIATADFCRVVPMKDATPEAGTIAANQATVLILKNINDFIVGR